MKWINERPFQDNSLWIENSGNIISWELSRAHNQGSLGFRLGGGGHWVVWFQSEIGGRLHCELLLYSCASALVLGNIPAGPVVEVRLQPLASFVFSCWIPRVAKMVSFGLPLYQRLLDEYKLQHYQGWLFLFICCVIRWKYCTRQIASLIFWKIFVTLF